MYSLNENTFKKLIKPIQFIFIFCLLFIPRTCFAETINDPNKTWKIIFNKAVMARSINNNIMVLDSKNNVVPAEISVSKNEKIVEVKPPKDGYARGERYVLKIKKDFMAENGLNLSTEYVKEFTIKEQMSCSKYREHLKENFKSYVANGVKINIDDYYVCKNEDGSLGIIVDINDSENYLNFLKSTEDKESINEFLNKIYDDAASQYGGKVICGGLYTHIMFDFCPEGYYEYDNMEYDFPLELWKTRKLYATFGSNNDNNFIVMWD